MCVCSGHIRQLNEENVASICCILRAPAVLIDEKRSSG